MKHGLSWFNVGSLAIGFLFLYLPIALLIIYSFNESRLVTVWGGFSTKWYGEMLRNESLLNAGWVTLQVAFATSCFAPVLGTIAGLITSHLGPLSVETSVGSGRLVYVRV